MFDRIFGNRRIMLFKWWKNESNAGSFAFRFLIEFYSSILRVPNLFLLSVALSSRWLTDERWKFKAENCRIYFFDEISGIRCGQWLPNTFALIPVQCACSDAVARPPYKINWCHRWMQWPLHDTFARPSIALHGNTNPRPPVSLRFAIANSPWSCIRCTAQCVCPGRWPYDKPNTHSSGIWWRLNEMYD